MIHKFIGGIGVLTVVVALHVNYAYADSSYERYERKLPRPTKDSDFLNPSKERIALGQMLFFDKELSGNRNISCATCHSPLIATVDGLSTNIGTGGHGLSVLRDAGQFPPTPLDPQSRGIRNMTPLFNLGHKEFTKLFWDGRIQVDPSVPQGFATPAGSDLPFGFDNALEALSIFAITDLQEMTGEPGTNELADASLESPQAAVWRATMTRLRAIPEYIELFTAAFPEIANDESKMSIVHVGKSIGAFQAAAFRSDNSSFDQFLRGDKNAINKNARRGMQVFYGKGNCSGCHSGIFQTDHDFYAIGIPQVGPGFGDGTNGREDFGREGFTGDSSDRYRFRTPSLRNVALTGPWGHDGFYNSLEAIRHHLDPVKALDEADPSQIVMPPRPDLDAMDLIAFNDPESRSAIRSTIELAPVNLTDEEIKYLLEFLHALTDSSAQDLRHTVPSRVPSGLPLAEIR